KAQDDLISRLTKEKNEAVSDLEVLMDEKAGLEEDVKSLQDSVTAQYEEGFQYALEQVKVIFPDIDEERLGEADTLKK
ncbi:hypothetical protein A2U01_0097282, partial [Trifolium medium]|nr:hypothetical protein [Trifolium medium]